MAPSRDADGETGLLGDIYRSTVFLTRLPAPTWPAAHGRTLAEASWAFTIPGIAVATIGGLVYAASVALLFPPLVGALLALAAMSITTGGLHEDGLADLADGAWGGASPERRLEIMSDSRIGTYGTVALILSFGCRAAAIAEIGNPTLVLGALVAAAALSRATMPAIMALGRPAKADGLGASAGIPSGVTWGAGVAIAIIAASLAAPGGTLGAVFLSGAAAAVCSWLAARKLGGYTGDTLGAAQQAAEIFALTAIAAALALPMD